MADMMTGLGLVEIILLAGVFLAFVVHPVMFILAGLRALVLGASSSRRLQTSRVASGSMVLSPEA